MGNALTLDRSLLASVIDHVRAPAGTRSATQAVSAEALAATERWNPDCRCEDLGLVPGLPVSELVELEEGCTRDHPARGVCARLDAVRRRYGK